MTKQLFNLIKNIVILVIGIICYFWFKAIYIPGEKSPSSGIEIFALFGFALCVLYFVAIVSWYFLDKILYPFMWKIECWYENLPDKRK